MDDVSITVLAIIGTHSMVFVAAFQMGYWLGWKRGLLLAIHARNKVQESEKNR